MPSSTRPPQGRYASFPCTGVLNEWLSPIDVGGSGLTAGNNFIYHRQGSWGKRPGVQRSALPSGGKTTLVSGVRWYRAYPSPLTKLVVYANNHLFWGNDQFSLHDLGSFNMSGATAPSFCSMRDPQASGGQGADILIICGLTQPGGSTTGSPATGSFTITGAPGTAPVSSYINVQFTNGLTVVQTANYQILGSDTAASIAEQITELINQTSAYLRLGSTPPFLGETYFTAPNPIQATGQAPNPQATVFMGAYHSGTQGNAIGYIVTLSDGSDPGSTLAIVNGSGSFSGGGQSWSGPLRFDGNTGLIEALSYMFPNVVAFCCTWHDHAWFWGDQNNPDTVWACDINQPEAFTFMVENGGLTGSDNGGYDIGLGDGDPAVQLCLPAGNALYVFKTNSIYMIQGYDFQQGEYQFSVTPQVVGYGIPAPYCADVLEGQIVFWSGRKALRLAIGAYEPEHIGMPIPISEGIASAGNQVVVRVVAGDLQVQSPMTNDYQPGGDESTTVILRSLALFAFDFGSGRANHIMVFDDEKTVMSGEYAWSPWTGWDVGCWIKYGLGPSPTGTNTDKPVLNFIDPNGNNFHVVGGNPTADWGNPIPWKVQTGWVDFGSPEVIKDAKLLFANLEANAGANLVGAILPGQIVTPSPTGSQYGTAQQTVTFNPTIAPDDGEADNDLSQYIVDGQVPGQQPIQARAIMAVFSEDGTAFAGFEMKSWGLDVIQEALAT